MPARSPRQRRGCRGSGSSCISLLILVYSRLDLNISEGVRGIATPSFRRLLVKVYRPVARLEGRAVTTSIRSGGNNSMQESRYTTAKFFIMVWYLGLAGRQAIVKVIRQKEMTKGGDGTITPCSHNSLVIVQSVAFFVVTSSLSR